MNETRVYRICLVNYVWNKAPGMYGENVEVIYNAKNNEIEIKNSISQEKLVFTLGEWEEINKFIAEELEANAEPDS
jgi:hypothetical protein